MSRSESPRITQFFKPQRKRPRGGKDDVVMTASKKILLEEGIISSPGGGKEKVSSAAPKKLLQEEGIISSPGGVKGNKEKDVSSAAPRKLLQEEETIISSPSESSSTRNDEGGGGSLTQKDGGGGGERSARKDDGGGGAPSRKEAGGDKGRKADGAGDGGSGGDGGGSTTQKEVRGGERSANVVQSPIKFTKVASLSPAKRKKMTTEQVARLLKKKTNLKDLKAALAGINQCSEKLSEFRRTVAESSSKLASPVKAQVPENEVALKSSSAVKNATAAGVSPAQFYSPTPADRLKADLERLSASKTLLSPSKLVNMNNKIKKRLFEEQGSPYKEKEKETKAPAYQRLHNLAQKTAAEKGLTDQETDLPLPFHFKILKEIFVAVETVVGIMKGRKETILFPKLKTAVVELFKKVTLREKHLAQIVTVLPNCYTFSVEKVGTDYHIKVDAEEMLPSVVCERRKAFHANLIKICLEQHQKFLLGLAPPIVVPKDKQITRWHPMFRLDEIPDIIPAKNALPTKPEPDKISTAREVIAKAQHILENANPRMKQAVKNMLNSPEVQSPQTAPAKQKSAATIKSLKGVSSSLLEKIRNREREKLLNEMTRSPAESKKLQMAKRLPNFIKIIRNMMVAEKKVAIPMGKMVERVSHSIQGMTEVDAEAHLRLLTTLLPNWAKVHKIAHSDLEYFRIDKNADINNLLQEMDDVIKRLS